MRTPRVLLPMAMAMAMALALAGCGGDEPAAKKPAPASTKAAASATATPAAAGGLARYSLEFGISALMPADWKADKEAKYHGVIFAGPKDDGAIGFYVEEKTDTPQEWLDNIVLSDKRLEVVARRKVSVPGLGKGIRVTLRYPKKDPQYDLYVATIDGVFVQITVHPGSQLTKGQVNRILTSVRRKV